MEAMCMLGAIVNDTAAAEKHLSRATAVFPFHAPSLRYRGLLSIQKDHKKGVEFLQKACQNGPENAENYLALARAYVKKKDRSYASAAEAGKCVEIACRLEISAWTPAMIAGERAGAYLLWREGRLQDAIDRLHTCVERFTGVDADEHAVATLHGSRAMQREWACAASELCMTLNATKGEDVSIPYVRNVLDVLPSSRQVCS